MPGLIRHPVMALDSAKASQVPGLRRNDKLKVFNCQVNIIENKGCNGLD